MNEDNPLLKKLNTSNNRLFWIFKRIFDIIISMALSPAMFIVLLILICLNPLFNRGNIFFVQKRMGKNCKPFKIIKFRSMVCENSYKRSYADPLEIDRITSLGKLLRKTRLDELPQIINVLLGEMSLIGPRPDTYDHALFFVENIVGYRERHSIRPGLTGLSQIRLGYVEGIEKTKTKASLDIHYINHIGFLLDAKIFFGTIYLIIKSFFR
ncbi:sugar transferase [Amylibacter sp.]|nr:sugar transferase [Amylibacter sp.]MDC1532062.1 sugar transferase [Amylibacter sp.]